MPKRTTPFASMKEFPYVPFASKFTKTKSREGNLKKIIICKLREYLIRNPKQLTTSKAGNGESTLL